jgi:hypothetical protein
LEFEGYAKLKSPSRSHSVASSRECNRFAHIRGSENAYQRSYKGEGINIEIIKKLILRNNIEINK